MSRYSLFIRGLSDYLSINICRLTALLIIAFCCFTPLMLIAQVSPSNRPAALQNHTGEDEPQRIKKHILIITSQPYHTDWFNTLNNSLREKLFLFLTSDSKLSYEYIGSESLTDPEYDGKVEDLLRKKYANIRLDMVIAVMPVSSQFVLDHGESLFPGIAVVFVLPSKEQLPKISRRPKSGLVKSIPNAIPETIERIQMLLPDTKNLLVVSGGGMDDLSYQQIAREALKNKKWPENVEYLKGMPAEDLASRLERLPKPSAVLMLTYLQDQNGVPLTTVQVMKTVSTRTTAPIFSFYDTIFGLGIVGGKLTSAEAYGDAIAETAKKMFREGQSLPAVETVAQARDIYDWRQIEKWRIPANRFPAGSDIRNRKISFWQQHLHKIILVSAVILLQTLLILALSINMIRRKRVETALSAAEKKYLDHLEEQVKERTEEIEQTNKKLLLEIGERTRTEKALVISENMYRVLVESANSIILRWTSKGEITFINQFAQQFFGFNLDEIIGQNIIGTIVPEVETSGRRISGLVEDIVKNPAAYEGNVNENVKKNGQRVWVAWTNRPLTDENSQLVEILSIGTDITKLVEAEKELRDTMEELDRAKERAESADRLKSAFLATMSHELRTPLNSIIGFTGILIQRLGGPLNDEQDKQLNMVYNSARHLLDLINDVLDISKIEAEQLKVVSEPFNLRNSVEKIIKSSQPLADKKGIDLSVSIAPEIVEINSDCRRFEQIMLNLISNAIKFTEQGFVHVNCKTKDDKVIIEVKDSGIGIKKEDMGILFNAFQQIETGITRKYDGTGLGLSICKKLAHLLGGEIIVESEWGAGSTFSLILPKG